MPPHPSKVPPYAVSLLTLVKKASAQTCTEAPVQLTLQRDDNQCALGDSIRYQDWQLIKKKGRA